MLVATITFSLLMLLLMASAATKVFATYFHPTDDLEHWWEEDDTDTQLKSEILQHPSNFTDFR